jgi:hypothetical protein
MILALITSAALAILYLWIDYDLVVIELPEAWG